VAFVGTISLTVGLCYNAWHIPPDAFEVNFEATTNNKTGQAIADSDGTKPIIMTKNPHDPDTDHTNDLTNIQLHGLITDKTKKLKSTPTYLIDTKGQTLVNNGYLDTSSVPTDTDHPLFNIVLKKDIQNSDSTIPHEFDVSLTMDNKSITKHIVLTG
jgi:hypothetical protein